MSAKSSSKRPWSIVLCTLNWILWSNLTILFNKWILESTSFRYPILLTTWHLLFATLATQLLARTTTLLGTRASISMTPKLYMAKIAPIGILYSGSLVCSNTAYMYLNVGFIQMLKASGPVITLLASAVYGVTELTSSKLLNIGVITASVALTVCSEIQFSWVGVAVQVAALVFDALRLVLMQVLTSSSSISSSSTVNSSEGERERDEEATLGLNPSTESESETSTTSTTANPEVSNGNGSTENLNPAKMDPLLSLYYTAPICALMNGVLAWRAEVLPFLQREYQTQSQPQNQNGDGSNNPSFLGIILDTGLGVLLLNACVGFMLNVAVFTLIGKTSGLTMTLVSIPKNILLIVASVVLWGTRVSLLQAVGYTVALGGLVVYAGGGVYVAQGLRRVGRCVWGSRRGRGRGKGRYGYDGLDGGKEGKGVF
ncbi:triose-phosphate transporter family-domain-containing protein [Aspergillus varians]